MYKTCSRCGKIHDINFKCNAGRVYTAKRTEAEKVRYTTAWLKKAKQIKEDSRHLCAVCEDKGIFNSQKLEVHHIVKLKEAPESAFDDYNLICLCAVHHRAADAGVISKEYLKKLAERRISPPDRGSIFSHKN